MNLDLQLRLGMHWAQPCALCWCLETHPETVLPSAHPSIRGQPVAQEVPLKSPPQRVPSSENFKNLPSGFLFTPHALSMKISLNHSHWGRLVTVSPQGCILCGLAFLGLKPSGNLSIPHPLTQRSGHSHTLGAGREELRGFLALLTLRLVAGWLSR